MTACKVSIIVPVYNTSEYLKNCIDSLLAQTLSEIEIIAVNDGSTDNSFQILKEYQALHPNKVYVYNTENKGVSHARNFGVTKSSGQYLWFVDSDADMTLMLNRVKKSAISPLTTIRISK